MTPKLFPAKSLYPLDFNEFWVEYKPPKTASKPDALKAWKQTERLRPSQDVLIACVQAYNSWLADQSKSSGRECPKLHASTFLRQARYEGFMDDATAILEAQQGHSQADLSASAKTWEGAPLAALMAMLGGADGDTPREAIFDAWIAPTVMIRSMPMEIRCPSKFHRDYLENKFGAVIRRALGPDTQLTVAGKEKAPLGKG
jgi:hypothetical protein